jgi:hypothetical protein
VRHDEEHLFTPDFLLCQAGVLAVPDCVVNPYTADWLARVRSTTSRLAEIAPRAPC